MPGNSRLPHPECPHTFDCLDNKSLFASCLDAVNCHMFHGMTMCKHHGKVGLFLHQMILHHQNAVNITKSMLRHEDFVCAPEGLRLGHRADPKCVMKNILRSIVGSQNRQVQTLLKLLAQRKIPKFDDWAVPMGGRAEVVRCVIAYKYVQ